MNEATPRPGSAPRYSTLHQRIGEEIRRDGPLPFSRFMHHALYDPDDGFYATGGQAGRRGGDFITSVESGPLFGALIAKMLDEHWRSLGQPTPFLVTEAGAGVGTLYRTMHRAQPACLDALTWTLVEQSATLRSAHDSLPGTAWASSADLVAETQHLLIANELLDNLAFDIAERTSEGWRQVRVRADDATTSGFAFVTEAELETGANARLAELVPQATVGTQVPVLNGARGWLRRAQQRADTIVLFDYAATTAELAERGRAGWLRSYQAQQRGHDPLVQPGEWDITTDVAWDQLDTAGHLTVSTQADWLAEVGLDELVSAARETWHERAAIGDLAALTARSAISEAEALTAPDGLGAFHVLEWSRSPTNNNDQKQPARPSKNAPES